MIKLHKSKQNLFIKDCDDKKMQKPQAVRYILPTF